MGSEQSSNEIDKQQNAKVDDTFADIVGLSEEDLRENMKKDFPVLLQQLQIKKVDGNTPNYTLNGYRVGNFNVTTVDELEKENPTKRSSKKGTISLIEGTNTSQTSSFRRMVDIGHLQSLPENRNAVFQVASDFDALEATSFTQDSRNVMLTSYGRDLTQGPSACISAFPALVFRRYFAKRVQSMESEEKGKNSDNDGDEFYNLLSKLMEEYKEGELPFELTKAGYIKFKRNCKGPESDSYKKVGVGIHEGIQVTHGFRVDFDHHKKLCPSKSEKQIIHQVFTSTTDLKLANYTLASKDAVIEWTKQLLFAAYEGTIRAAIRLNSEKVYLTMVGCGAFRNNPLWVFDAINNVKQLIIDHGLQVYLIYYKRPLNAASEEAEFRSKIIQIVEETGGTLCVLSD